MRFILPALLVYSSATMLAQQAQHDSLKIGNVVVTGSLRSRVYFWDWFQPASGNSDYQYSGNLLRIGFSQNRDSWDWNAEFAAPFLLALPAGATGSRHAADTRLFAIEYDDFRHHCED